MNKTVREVLAAMEYQIKEKGIAVTVDSLVGCVGDKNMLDRVFINLIGNAIKYSDPAKKGEIKISGKVEDGMSIYCVEDNGIGIAPDHQENVFEIFHRLDPDDAAGGEGLGLTIVTRILDRLEGKIRLESEPDKGSKFFVSIPTKE
jgi:signal transduction histidine kinase